MRFYEHKTATRAAARSERQEAVKVCQVSWCPKSSCFDRLRLSSENIPVWPSFPSFILTAVLFDQTLQLKLSRYTNTSVSLEYSRICCYAFIELLQVQFLRIVVVMQQWWYSLLTPALSFWTVSLPFAIGDPQLLHLKHNLWYIRPCELHPSKGWTLAEHLK